MIDACDPGNPPKKNSMQLLDTEPWIIMNHISLGLSPEAQVQHLKAWTKIGEILSAS